MIWASQLLERKETERSRSQLSVYIIIIGKEQGEKRNKRERLKEGKKRSAAERKISDNQADYYSYTLLITT